MRLGTSRDDRETVRNVAIAHGKPMAFPESGAVISPNGGGDNPTSYRKKMHDFIVDPANNVVFHSYFNVSNASGRFDSRLSDSTAHGVPPGLPDCRIRPRSSSNCSSPVPNNTPATSDVGPSPRADIIHFLDTRN
jgi:hypothetical protein